MPQASATSIWVQGMANDKSRQARGLKADGKFTHDVGNACKCVAPPEIDDPFLRNGRLHQCLTPERLHQCG
jgi:hypothetical protein